MKVLHPRPMLDRRSVCVIASVTMLCMSLWYASAFYDDNSAVDHRQTQVTFNPQRPTTVRSSSSSSSSPRSAAAGNDMERNPDAATPADGDGARRPGNHEQEAAEKLEWDIERSSFDAQAAKIDEIKFTAETLQKILPSEDEERAYHQQQQQRSDSSALLRARDAATISSSLQARGCDPTKFFFVNTHTWGRHHNQLQEILHTIAFARRFHKRTAVLGFFRSKNPSRWWDSAEVYDMSMILATECAVAFSDFKVLWGLLRSAQSATAACFGQGTRATPLQKIVRCPLDASVPAHYKVRTGFATTRDNFFGMIMAKSAGSSFIGISGEIAFFLRPGIVTTAKLLARLRPAKAVAVELQSFLESKNLAPSPEMMRRWFGGRSLSSPSANTNQVTRNNNFYFSLHLRQREKECLKEVEETVEINPAMAARLSDSQGKSIRVQCAIPVSYVNEQLFDRYGIQSQSSTATKVFLASDHQNKELEEALVKRGAVMYSGKFGHASLQGLAVDFFALAAGANFSGNQLSSISQNACFLRLGFGMGCKGFVVDYSMHLSAPIAKT